MLGGCGRAAWQSVTGGAVVWAGGAAIEWCEPVLRGQVSLGGTAAERGTAHSAYRPYRQPQPNCWQQISSQFGSL